MASRGLGIACGIRVDAAARLWLKSGMMTIWRAVCSIVGLVFLAACGGQPTPAVSKFAGIIEIDSVAVTPRNATSVLVTYRVTNRSGVPLVRARTRLAVLDAAGAEIGVREGHYVVRSAGGGLAPGAVLKAEAPVTVTDPTKAAKAGFRIEFVRDATGRKILADGAAADADE